MDSDSSKNLVERLTQSRIYQDYARAFVETTGLPLSLQPVEAWQLAQRGHPKESPFCAIMAKSSRSCAPWVRSAS